MAGKKHRSRAKQYTSKGERRSSMKTPNRDQAQRLLNQVDALSKGKRIVMTFENPNKAETNKPFIRVMYDSKAPKGVILS